MSDNTTQAPSNDLLVVEYGEYKIADYRSLPANSISALLSSGLTHKMGNEVASKVTTAIKAAIREAANDPQLEVTDALRDAWKAANGPALVTMRKAAQDAMFASILDGTVGAGGSSGPRGPKLNELDLKVRLLATIEVGDALVRGGVLAKDAAGRFVIPGTSKEPTAKGPLFTVKAGEFSFPALVGRRVDAHGDRLVTEAKKILEAERRSAAKATAESDDL
jgi:hypothetical protein